MSGESNNINPEGVNTAIFGTGQTSSAAVPAPQVAVADTATAAAAPAPIPAIVSEIPAPPAPAAAAPAAAVPASPAQPEAAGTYQRLQVKEPNFRIDEAYSSGPVEFDPELPVVVFPAASREATLNAVRNAPNVDIAPGNRKIDRYATVIREGLNHIPMGNDEDEMRGDEGADFGQNVTVNDIKLMGFKPGFKKREGVRVSGEAARSLFRSRLGLGTLFSVPLWHSGFWVTLRTPTEGALLELHRELAQEKVLLGRATYGLLFSQMTGYTTKVMCDFVAKHIHTTSLKLESENDSLLNYISVADYQLLIWGLTCATWPTGYQFPTCVHLRCGEVPIRGRRKGQPLQAAVGQPQASD
jgi:hypothetical protein